MAHSFRTRRAVVRPDFAFSILAFPERLAGCLFWDRSRSQILGLSQARFSLCLRERSELLESEALAPVPEPDRVFSVSLRQRGWLRFQSRLEPGAWSKEGSNLGEGRSRRAIGELGPQSLVPDPGTGGLTRNESRHQHGECAWLRPWNVGQGLGGTVHRSSTSRPVPRTLKEELPS